MITDIYRKYFQKSYNFLYPLLGFKKHNNHKPVQTYIAWEGVCDKSLKKLICIYKKLNTPEWNHFEKEYLITHRMLDYCVPIDNNTIAYIFSFDSNADDYNAFCNGQYSTFCQQSKKTLSTYYGVHTPEWIFMESYLYPEKYYKKYADILGVDIELLRSTVELCEKYDEEKETCKIPHPEHVI